MYNVYFVMGGEGALQGKKEGGQAALETEISRPHEAECTGGIYWQPGKRSSGGGKTTKETATMARHKDLYPFARLLKGKKENEKTFLTTAGCVLKGEKSRKAQWK